MTYNIVDVHYTKKHPLSLQLDVAVCPGDNGKHYKLSFPTMEGNLCISQKNMEKLEKKLFNEFKEIYKVGEPTSIKIAKEVKNRNIQIKL